eukprot:Gb_17485 [translate_table: standard]
MMRKKKGLGRWCRTVVEHGVVASSGEFSSGRSWCVAGEPEEHFLQLSEAFQVCGRGALMFSCLVMREVLCRVMAVFTVWYAPGLMASGRENLIPVRVGFQRFHGIFLV